MATWGEFRDAEPRLAELGAELFRKHLMAWLATLRPSGLPRVHPVTPLIATTGRLYVFMEPTSPKAEDLRQRGKYALHCHVPDILGTWHGELQVAGHGAPVEGADARTAAAAAFEATGFGPPPDRYVLFELGIDEARGTDGGEEPSWTRWTV